LLNAAAGRGAAHHLIRHIKRVEHFQHEERDMRRLDHIAASVEDDIGRPIVFLRRAQLRSQSIQHLGRQL